MALDVLPGWRSKARFRPGRSISLAAVPGAPSRVARVERSRRRRRRLAPALLAGLAIGAFALGARLGESPSPSPAPPPSVVSTLPARQVAGERLRRGAPGTAISPPLRAAIATGRIAGVVLF